MDPIEILRSGKSGRIKKMTSVSKALLKLGCGFSHRKPLDTKN